MNVQEFLFTVRSLRELTPTVFELVSDASPLAAGGLAGFHFKAGQFISVVVPPAEPGARALRRAYSIASAPENPGIELCVKKIEEGPGSGYLSSLKPGDVFKGFAPYGDFLYKPIASRAACFIATGTGIAPFRSMILSEAYQASPPRDAMLLYGARAEDELLYYRELSQIPGLQLIAALSQQAPALGSSHFFRGRVTDYLRQPGQQGEFAWENTEFYLCGNGAMILELKAFLKDQGVPKEAIHSEAYYR